MDSRPNVDSRAYAYPHADSNSDPDANGYPYADSNSNGDAHAGSGRGCNGESATASRSHDSLPA